MILVLAWAGFNSKCKVAFIFSGVASVCAIQVRRANHMLLLSAAAPALKVASLPSQQADAHSVLLYTTEGEVHCRILAFADTIL